MSSSVEKPGAAESAAAEIDVRLIPKPKRHPLIFDAYHQLEVGESFTLLNDHEPKHLRDEFDVEFAGSFTWESAGVEGADFRVRITKLAHTALPRVVVNTAELLGASPSDATGSIWKLEPAARDLDSNVIALAAGAEIAQHVGPDLDVLFVVLAGTGELETELNTLPLTPGEVIWLPKKAQRRIVAGPEGLRYLTVHHRKPTLNITAAPMSLRSI